MNVAVSARRADALKEVVEQLRSTGAQAEPITCDLQQLDQLDSLIERTETALGPIDLLINNAGVETPSGFVRYTNAELCGMVDLNLNAPMLLTRRVLPGMLERGGGHVVFIASLAGKIGPAYEAPYAATKAALIGLTQSLRAEYRRAPVGFSVICPGFVAGEGMYQRMVDQGIKSNRLLGSTTIEKVVDRVVEAIRNDQPEVVESGGPVRPLLALGQVAPRLVERAMARAGATELFKRTAAARNRAD